MLRSQRALLVVVLVVIAATLHFSLCDWVWDVPQVATVQGPPRILLIGFSHQGSTGVLVTGIVSGKYPQKMGPLLLGLITPIGLLGAAAYLMLGWRHSLRATRGLCIHCGYDLRGAPAGRSEKYPECGQAAPRE